MIVLAIESATELVGVAVACDEGPTAATWVLGRRRHAESLAPAVAHLLEQVELSLEDLDVVAVDVGPGLFTGLRVGVATAQGLAQGLGLGVVGVTSLDVLARAAFDAGWDRPVAAIVDARRAEVFHARYEPDGGATEPARATPEALAAELATGGEVLCVGDGARRYAGTLSSTPGVRVAGPSLAGPPPAVLAALAAERVAAGSVPEPPQTVRPRYLREADARINWSQRRTAEG